MEVVVGCVSHEGTCKEMVDLVWTCPLSLPPPPHKQSAGSSSEPEDAHLPEGDEDVNIADFARDSSSGMSSEKSSIDFLPCSTDLQDKLPKVDVAPQPEDAHLPQSDKDVNIAYFVPESSLGMSAEKSSIDFLPCSTDLQEKLPKVDMSPQPEDAYRVLKMSTS